MVKAIEDANKRVAIIAHFIILPAKRYIPKVEPRGFEPLTSAVQRRHHTFLERSRVCKIAANKRIYYSIAFPVVSEDLLGLLHGCCTGRLRSPSCIDAREQRKLATWTSLLFPFCPRTPHVSNLHGGAGLSTLTTGGREASWW